MTRKIGVLFSYILMALEILSAFFFTPFLIKSFGDAEYGVYSLVISITSYLALLDLGIGNAIVRYASKFYITKDEKQLNNFAAISILFYLVIAILTMIVGFVIVKFLPSFFNKGLTTDEQVLAQQLMWVTMGNVALTFVFTTFDKIILSEQRYAVQKIIAIAKIVFRIAISIIALSIGFKSMAIMLINLIMTIVFGIVSMLYSVIKLKLRPKLLKNNNGFIKEIVLYTSAVFINMVATHMNSMIDSILIGKIVATSSVLLAVYSVGAQIIQYYQSIASGVNGVLMPGVVSLYEQTKDPDIIQKEMSNVGRVVFMMLGLIFVVFAVVGKEFIILWVGPSKVEAYYVALILMTVYLFYMTQSICGNFLWAASEHKIHSIIKLIIVLINIVLTIFLIKWNALIGASIGTAISILLGDIIATNIVLHKRLKINIKNYYRDLFKGIVPVLLSTFLIGLAAKSVISSSFGTIIQFLLISILMVAVFLIGIYLFGMNENEVVFIQNLKAKFIKNKLITFQEINI